MRTVVVMTLVGVLWGSAAWAQTNLQLSFTTRQMTALTQMRDIENTDRAMRGVPETRFCDDDPLVCAQPSTLKFLQARVENLLASHEVNQTRRTSERIKRFCEANPTNGNCVSIADVAP